MSVEIIFDIENNQITEKPYSNLQIKEAEEWLKNNAAKKAELELKQLKKTELLERLGITEEEAKLLLG